MCQGSLVLQPLSMHVHGKKTRLGELSTHKSFLPSKIHLPAASNPNDPAECWRSLQLALGPVLWDLNRLLTVSDQFSSTMSISWTSIALPTELVGREVGGRGLIGLESIYSKNGAASVLLGSWQPLLCLRECASNPPRWRWPWVPRYCGLTFASTSGSEPMWRRAPKHACFDLVLMDQKASESTTSLIN